MNALERQRIHSDLSGQGVVYAIALVVLIAYLLIASGVVKPTVSAPPAEVAPPPQAVHGLPQAD